MNLRTRVAIIYVCITLIIVALIGGVLPVTLQEQSLNAISEKSIGQLKLIDFSISQFIQQTGSDMHEIAHDRAIPISAAPGFTNYLNWPENSSDGPLSEEEMAAIDELMAYHDTHPSVDHVFVGYEDGSFIKSGTWEPDGPYDPRQRPWYILAMENPGETVITDQYLSDTSPEAKVVVATTIHDENNEILGVVGSDLTLSRLTSFLSDIALGSDGHIILTDEKGTFLASDDSSAIFTDVSGMLGDQTDLFLSGNEGALRLDNGYFVYYTSPELGWKICEFIPNTFVDQEINSTVWQTLFVVIVALIILGIITLAVFDRTIIKPISDLTRVSRRIAETGDLDQEIETGGSDEIGTLGRSFNSMVEKIRSDEIERKKLEGEMAVSLKQIEENMAHFAMLNDEIRNPLTVIVARADFAEKDIRDPILDQAKEIDKIINRLDKGWLQSEKIWKFLKRYYGINPEPREKDEESKDNGFGTDNDYKDCQI